MCLYGEYGQVRKRASVSWRYLFMSTICIVKNTSECLLHIKPCILYFSLIWKLCVMIGQDFATNDP